jgi:dTDP-4-amino-4,6-dideoxygalactose transaminase
LRPWPVLPKQVQARRRNFAFYQEALGHLPGIRFMPEAPLGRHNRRPAIILIDPARFGADLEAVRLALEAENIWSSLPYPGQKHACILEDPNPA